MCSLTRDAKQGSNRNVAVPKITVYERERSIEDYLNGGHAKEVEMGYSLAYVGHSPRAVVGRLRVPSVR